MEKLVYLFELDSVRKTDEEIYHGQLAMYDELVGNGNIIVMSMNQITDSKAFLCMLESEERYNIIKELFQCGVIRISRYGGIRTVSQYMQGAINKNLAKNEDSFIFSALPVKGNQKKLLKLMQQVLVNADLSAIKEYRDKGDDESQEVIELFREYNSDGTSEESRLEIDKAKYYLGILYRFLELTLLISMNDIVVNPPIKYDDNYKKRDFCDFMKEILSFNIDTLGEMELWERSVEILKEILFKLENTTGESGKNNRSVWLKQLKQINQLKATTDIAHLYYAELIVNLCYNYTVEWSIYGVSKHYEREALNIGEKESLKNEFFSRLKSDWNSGRDAESRFLQGETNTYEPYTEEYPDWQRGLEIISRRKRGHTDSKNKKIPLYEYCYNQERKQRKIKDIKNLLKVFVTIIIYIVVIYCMDKGLSYFEEYIGEFLKSIMTVVIITLISVVIDKFLEMPNMTECLEMLRNCVIDSIIIIRGKSEAYINKQNLSSEYKESVPSILKEAENRSSALEEYIQLWKTKPCVFKESDQITIVEPEGTGIQEILEYEMIYNTKIGVVYKSSYHMLVVDLIRDENGGYYTYERLIPAVQQGAVVIVPIYKNKFVLLKQFRHAIRGEQWSFPRGYGERDIEGNDLNIKANIRKELEEELGAVTVREPELLGYTVPDSGISANKVAIYTAVIEAYEKRLGYEGIKEVKLWTEQEMCMQIDEGQINDGFTLAAYTLYMHRNRT